MLSDILKAETREEHLRSEKELIKQIRNIRHPSDYGEILRAFYTIYHHAEDQMNQLEILAIFPDMQKRRNCNVLRDDLQKLGESMSSAQAPEFTFDSLAEAAGALYVMEGSSMGGRILKEMICKTHPELSDACSFWDFYGAEVFQKWQVFLMHLNKAENDFDPAAAVNGAKKIFQHLHSALQLKHEHS